MYITKGNKIENYQQTFIWLEVNIIKQLNTTHLLIVVSYKLHVKMNIIHRATATLLKKFTVRCEIEFNQKNITQKFIKQFRAKLRCLHVNVSSSETVKLDESMSCVKYPNYEKLLGNSHFKNHSQLCIN